MAPKTDSFCLAAEDTSECIQRLRALVQPHYKTDMQQMYGGRSLVQAWQGRDTQQKYDNHALDLLRYKRYTQKNVSRLLIYGAGLSAGKTCSAFIAFIRP